MWMDLDVLTLLTHYIWIYMHIYVYSSKGKEKAAHLQNPSVCITGSCWEETCSCSFSDILCWNIIQSFCAKVLGVIFVTYQLLKSLEAALCWEKLRIVVAYNMEGWNYSSNKAFWLSFIWSHQSLTIFQLLPPRSLWAFLSAYNPHLPSPKRERERRGGEGRGGGG